MKTTQYLMEKIKLSFLKLIIMNDYILLKRYPEIKELIFIFRNDVQQSKRPANEVILNDQDVMKMLHISKRKLDYLKPRRIIPFSQPISRSSFYYRLSDILKWLEESGNESLAMNNLN
jgi:hypothetical protein